MRVLRGAAGSCLLCMLAVAPAALTKEIWLDVPFVAQVGNGCGPACISMVMKYWAASLRREPAPGADQDTIRRSVNAPDSKGMFTRQVSQYFESHGFRAFAFEGAWADLEHQITKGRPLIVALELSSGTFHYLVVAGLDSEQGIILANDPARRKLLKLKRADFEKAWSHSGYWTLLALPDDER